MAKAGRKSKASREIAPLVASLPGQIREYPKPPCELSSAEADVWRRVVVAKDASWFDTSNYPLLVQYCRHVIRANRMAELIAAIEDDIDRRARGLATISPVPDLGYLDLIRTMQAESRSIAMLATKMRIAQQSTIDERSALAGVGKKSSGGELWD